MSLEGPLPRTRPKRWVLGHEEDTRVAQEHVFPHPVTGRLHGQWTWLRARPGLTPITSSSPRAPPAPAGPRYSSDGDRLSFGAGGLFQTPYLTAFYDCDGTVFHPRPSAGWCEVRAQRPSIRRWCRLSSLHNSIGGLCMSKGGSCRSDGGCTWTPGFPTHSPPVSSPIPSRGGPLGDLCSVRDSHGVSPPEPRGSFVVSPVGERLWDGSSCPEGPPSTRKGYHYSHGRRRGPEGHTSSTARREGCKRES